MITMEFEVNCAILDVNESLKQSRLGTKRINGETLIKNYPKTAYLLFRAAVTHKKSHSVQKRVIFFSGLVLRFLGWSFKEF